MIKIVDYGLGNIRALLNVYKRLNVPVAVGSTAEELTGASKLILPGVGAFDHAMELIERSGLRDTLDEMVLERRVPVLGICVGMQILSHSSDEGRKSGLGWISGRVRALKLLVDEPLMLPHLGWNDVRPLSHSPLFKQLESDARFYFLHSYYMECERQGDVAAVCHYGSEFACAVSAGSIHGVQFHPEKSHHYGTQLLKNFAEL
jgi:glutamine amidotransferase